MTNQDELLALAKVDWEKAVPFLERLVGDRSQPVFFDAREVGVLRTGDSRE